MVEEVEEVDKVGSRRTAIEVGASRAKAITEAHKVKVQMEMMV
jgi:hypothetical protein